MNNKFALVFTFFLGILVTTCFGKSISLFFHETFQKETLYQLGILVLQFLGLLTLTLLLLWAILHSIYGKNWWLKFGINFFAGAELKESALKVVQEGSEGKIRKETYTELVVSVFKRLTRVGGYALVVALIPFLLLFQQNTILKSQSELIKGQTELMKSQDFKLSVQNNLLEADRRSSLVFLMSNVLDRVDTEIKEQKKKPKGGYKLSVPLIGRITALSKAFKPYRVLENDSLAINKMSPERGQLFIALMKSGLDSMTQNRIVREGDFSYADIGKIVLEEASLVKGNFSFANFREASLIGADLRGANLNRTDLSKANFSEANLSGAKIRGTHLMGTQLIETILNGVDLRVADLREADLIGAKLQEVNLRGADVSGADLRGADLRRAILGNIKSDSFFQQLKKAYRLYECENLDETIKIQLRDEKIGSPCLFSKAGCLENRLQGQS